MGAAGILMLAGGLCVGGAPAQQAQPPESHERREVDTLDQADPKLLRRMAFGTGALPEQCGDEETQEEDLVPLFRELMEGHRSIERATFNYKVVDVLAGEITSISQVGMVAVDRGGGTATQKFHVRGALIDHHPLGRKLSHIRPVESVNASYDGKVLTYVDEVARETRTSTDPKLAKRLAQKALWFLPTWLQPEPFAKERRYLDTYEKVQVTREPDAQVDGIDTFALRLRAQLTYAANPELKLDSFVHTVDNVYYFDKERRILRRVIEGRSGQFVQISDVLYLAVNPVRLPDWTFDSHPPEDFARREGLPTRGPPPGDSGKGAR